MSCRLCYVELQGRAPTTFPCLHNNNNNNNEYLPKNRKKKFEKLKEILVSWIQIHLFKALQFNKKKILTAKNWAFLWEINVLSIFLSEKFLLEVADN